MVARGRPCTTSMASNRDRNDDDDDDDAYVRNSIQVGWIKLVVQLSQIVFFFTKKKNPQVPPFNKIWQFYEIEI